MTVDRFSYRALFQVDETQPSGLIAMRRWAGPLQAVIWSHSTNRWAYNPRVAARLIFDDEYEDRRRMVSREEAERIARERLGAELPSEEVLLQMCQAGAQAQG